MIKRLFLITILIIIAAALFGCGGSGDSTASAPVGVNPGVASRVELMATSNIIQTNSYCYFKAKVIDGNGMPIKNMEVVFTNLSLTGVFDHTTAVTGTNGIATVTLYSTTPGFATVQAEVNAGTEKIRDKKTVFFSLFDIGFPTGAEVAPALVLDVDSDNDGVFDEPDDFIMLDPPTKTDAIIRATVTDEFGAPVLNSEVTFGADSPEVTFPLASDPDAPVVHTNIDGQASVLARISPLILRSTDSTVNIFATADNGSFNVLTLFLKPITVGTISVTAVPPTIASAATSEITAAVRTTAGTPVPDGTTVNFSVSSGVGAVTPFGQTTDGVATATFTAPTVTVNSSGTVRASAGSASGTVTVNITAPVVVTPALAVAPPTGAASSAAGATLTFAISGGTGPYAVLSSNLASACRDFDGDNLCTDPPDFATWTVTTAAPTFAVRVPVGTPAGTVVLTITDSSTPAKTATVVITVGP